MVKIAIVGAGRVGTAVAKILLMLTDNEVAFIDTSEEALADAYEQCAGLSRPEHRVAFSPSVPVETYTAGTEGQLRATLVSLAPRIIVCCTPFNVNVLVARFANELHAHYIDFTEDNSVTEAISSLKVHGVTFVPQTGLAPGLVSYLGLSLFETLDEPSSLDLRVGALPQVSFGPAHYAMTWSPEGLINEYLKPTLRKVQNELQEIPALDDVESLIVNGIQYEGFTTSGGVGDLAAYAHIPTVQYKTLRFPGHLQFMQKFLAKVDYDFDSAVLLAKQTFETTRDDVVVLVAHAADTDGKSVSAGLHFYPSEDLGLTALELTTAGTGVAIIELILAGELPTGVLNASDIPFQKFLQTAAATLVFDYLA